MTPARDDGEAPRGRSLPGLRGVQGNRLHYTQLGQTFRHYVKAAGVNECKRVAPHPRVNVHELRGAIKRLRWVGRPSARYGILFNLGRAL
jgi:hypothetical protein